MHIAKLQQIQQKSSKALVTDIEKKAQNIYSESSSSHAQNFSRNVRISEERSVRTRFEELQFCNVLNLVIEIIKHA